MMNTAAIPEAGPATQRWIVRTRVVLAACLLWAVLRLVLNMLRRGGVDTPVMLTYGHVPVLPVLLAAAGVGGVALLFRALRVRRGSLEPFVACALGFALLVMPGGTMTDYLAGLLPSNSTPRAGAYWRLLMEYLAVLLVSLPLYYVAGWLPGGPRRGLVAPPAPHVPDRADKARQQGELIALLITTVVAGVVMWILSGARLDTTQRQQVFFAVYAGFAAGTYAALYVSSVRTAASLLLAPLVLGAAGCVYAAMFAKLPPGYDHLNIIPVVPLVRPLPLEMVALGWLGIATVLHARAAAAHESRK